MRIAIVYDCFYPNTVGGAERWYRSLAERLSEGNEVTYLTRRQWGKGDSPEASFDVCAVSGGGPLYTKSGRRRIWPPIRFGIGVFMHLLRHAHRYDIVHSASFPYFSLIGAWLALRLRRGAGLVVDWHELWTRDYWQSYLGLLGGRLGYAVQRLCVRVPAHSFTFSQLHAARLAEQGHRAPVVRLTGEYSSDDGLHSSAQAGAGAPEVDYSLVVFAGRHIPEKGVIAVPDAIALARQRVPALHCLVFGDGPERKKVDARVRSLGLEKTVEVAGRVPAEEVHRVLERAACLLLPSRREGYGLVVVEAAARGTPTIVVRGPDNAATELIDEGINGLVADSADPATLADAVAEVIERGQALRHSTLDWYRTHADELSIDSSLLAVEDAYRQLTAGGKAVRGT